MIEEQNMLSPEGSAHFCNLLKDAFMGGVLRIFMENKIMEILKKMYLIINKFIIFVTLVTDFPSVQVRLFHRMYFFKMEILSSFFPPCHVTKRYLKPKTWTYKLKRF